MTGKSGALTYFVTQTNPEIFEVTPRPGGLAKIDIPPKRSRLKEKAAQASKANLTTSQARLRSRSRLAKSKTSAVAVKAKDKPEASRKSLLTISTTYQAEKELDVDACPREFKVKQIIAATPWSVEFDEYLEPTEESKRIPDPFQDSVDMLAMSFSVIMLLSRGYDKISNTHFKWVLSYLDCIRDEFDKTPPNIQGILNHINLLTGGKIKSYLDEAEDYEPIELKGREMSVRIAPTPPEQSPPPPEEEEES